MPQQNIIQRTLHPEAEVQYKFNVWVDGRWLYYHPTLSMSNEVREWGGRWDKKLRSWRLPALVRMARKIAEYDEDAQFSMEAEILRIGDVEGWDATAFKGDLARRAKKHPAWKELKPYQQEAVMALVTRAFHGMGLILSPGLGKTPVTIVAADLLLQVKPEGSGRVLIVAPLSLLDNWWREITGNQIVNELMGQKQIQWSDDPRVETCHGVLPTADRSVRWTLTNYETPMERVKDPNTGRVTASGNLNEDWDFDWQIVAYDESVMLKNRKSKRTTSHRTLARAADNVWKLSGSNITHDNSDAWAQMNMMEPDYFTSFWTFARESCVVVKTVWSQGEIQGSRNNFSMREQYPDLLFVRNQEEVFDDLPENIFEDIELPLTKLQKKAHDDILDLWLHELEANRDKRVEVTAVIAMLTRLQQVTSNLYNLQTTGEEWPDASSKADFMVEDLTRGDLDWPVLVWVHHRPGAHALLDRLRKAARTKRGDALYGKRIELVVGGNKKHADASIAAYKAGEVDVLILGIGVGKYGHTLANSRTVYIYDKTWDSDAWFQMLHRFGGARALLAGYRHRPVVKTLRCRQTVDDFIELNLAGKLPAMAALTGADLAKILRSLGSEFVPS